VSHAPADRPTGRIEVDLVFVAPAPVLAGFERPDDRMASVAEMGGGVLVLGIIAAAHVAAGHAEPQMDPAASGPQTVLATVRAGGDLPDLIEVAAPGHHINQPTTPTQLTARLISSPDNMTR